MSLAILLQTHESELLGPRGLRWKRWEPERGTSYRPRRQRQWLGVGRTSASRRFGPNSGESSVFKAALIHWSVCFLLSPDRLNALFEHLWIRPVSMSLSQPCMHLVPCVRSRRAERGEGGTRWRRSLYHPIPPSLVPIPSRDSSDIVAYTSRSGLVISRGNRPVESRPRRGCSPPLYH